MTTVASRHFKVTAGNTVSQQLCSSDIPGSVGIKQNVAHWFHLFNNVVCFIWCFNSPAASSVNTGGDVDTLGAMFE